MPNPEVDPISVIFYCVFNEDLLEMGNNGLRPGFLVGVIAIQDTFNIYKMGISGISFILFIS